MNTCYVDDKLWGKEKREEEDYDTALKLNDVERRRPIQVGRY